MMQADDVADIIAIAAVVHPAFPEREAVFAERLGLFPNGSLMLADGDRTAGYAVAYPARLGHPVGVDMLIGALPIDADTLYVHDVAILPSGRGAGHAGEVIEIMARAAILAGLPCLSLVAIYGADAVWERQGFTPRPDLIAPAKLASYGSDAVYMTCPITMV